MVKKLSGAPRTASGPAKRDVATRVPAEAISHRAYHLFEARGSDHGHDVEDWLVAETELLGGQQRRTRI